jgi:hypothetical protein
VPTPVLIEWIGANGYWLGYATMALLGGAISHQLAFEKTDVDWVWSKHVQVLLGCWTKAAFIALVIFYLSQEYKWSGPLSFVATGVFSVFGTEAITTFYQFLKKRLGMGGEVA